MKVHNPNNLPTIPIADLIPSQGDLKDLTETNYKKLKNVIEHRGFSYPVYVWEDKAGIKHLLDGHQRQRVLKTEGWNEPIPYLKVPAENYQEAMARLLEITSQYATITQEGIDTFIAEKELNEAEVYEATSYDALKNYGDDEKDVDVEEDEAPEVDESEPPKSKLGEIYQLGRHRVMCGDSTTDVKILLDDKKANMAFTDPPYNVDYGANQSPIWGKSRTILNDKMSDEEWEIFIDKFNKVLVDNTDGGIYIAMSCKELDRVKQSFENVGGHWSSYIIWVKQQLVPGRKDYQSKYEPILYGWREGLKDRYFKDSRKETDVWEHDRPSRSEEHPTMKPISLVVQALQDSSREKDIVLDLFLGSGTTLIACEQTDRTCFGMELDPKYVDVIRKRYAKFIQPDDQLPENWEELTPAIERELSDGKS